MAQALNFVGFLSFAFLSRWFVNVYTHSFFLLIMAFHSNFGCFESITEVSRDKEQQLDGEEIDIYSLNFQRLKKSSNQSLDCCVQAHFF